MLTRDETRRIAANIDELRGGEAEAAQPVEQRLIAIRRLDNAGQAVDPDAVTAMRHLTRDKMGISFNSLAEIETLARRLTSWRSSGRGPFVVPNQADDDCDKRSGSALVGVPGSAIKSRAKFKPLHS